MERIADLIDRRIEVLTKHINKLDSKIKSLPKGSVYIKRVGKRTYYYLFERGSKERILRNSEETLKEKILQRKYLESVADSLRKELKVLRKTAKEYPKVIVEEVYEQLPEEFKKHVTPIVPTDSMYASRWMERPYTHKQISDDVPFFKTMNGERVRSKSEVIIADRLSLNSVPYKYECPLVLQIDDELITIHPDFTLLRMSDRKVLYFEHCGMMDNEEYADELVKRINQYSRAGIILGDRLFLMFETSKTPLDVRVLDNLINSRFK